MVLPTSPWGSSHLWTVSPCASGQGMLPFWLWRPFGFLAWEEYLQVVTPLPGVPWQMEWIEVMMTIVLIGCGKRNVDPL